MCPGTRQRALKDFFSYVEVVSFSVPLLIHSSCTFRTAQYLLSMVNISKWKEVPWKFGWLPAMAWSLMTQNRALCSIKKSYKLSAEYVTGFRDNKVTEVPSKS
jgi:hypothetical protein